MPTGTYVIQLRSDKNFYGLSCLLWAEIGEIKIDASGHGSKTAEVTGLKGVTNLWIQAFSVIGNTNVEADRSAVAHV